MDVEAKIKELEAAVEAYEYQIRVKDAGIANLHKVIQVLSAWGTYVGEQIPDDEHREAVDYVYNNVPLDVEACLDILVDYNCTSRHLHEREYNVTVTIPVYFSMTVTASDEDGAYDTALNDVGSMWLSDIIDGYTCDFDGSEINITDIEESY